MKKLFFLFAIGLFLSCSSDDQNVETDDPNVEVPTVFDPNIIVNGANFEIKFAGKFSEIGEGKRMTQFVLDYTDEVCVRCGTPPNYKRIILRLYTNASEDSIEGTYNLSQSTNQIPYMSAGYYLSGYPIYLYAGSVTVTKLGNKRYKLQFNAVKGRFYLNDSSPTDIEGYFDGDFTELEKAYWQ